MIQDNEAVVEDKGKLRKKIRKAIAAILKNKTAADDRVFPNASVPAWVEELPVITIYPGSESASKYAEAPRELERDLSVVIEIQAEGPEENVDLQSPPPFQETLEDILDDMAEQVECEMSRDDTLRGTADDCILINTEFEFQGDGSAPIGSARLTFAITYFTMYPRSATKQNINLSDYKTAKVDYNIGDDELTREAKDTVDIPQT